MAPVSRKPNLKPYKERPVSVDQPLEFLRATTYRQRQVCLTLEAVTRGDASKTDIIEACQFLAVELVLHHFDETEDVVPLLRERCKSEDNIEPVLADLDVDQGLVRSLGLKVSRALMAQMSRSRKSKPTKALRAHAGDLLVALRRLSAIENGIILPMARARFTVADLDELSLRMAMRRGWAT